MTTASRIAFASLLALACGAAACSTEVVVVGDPSSPGAPGAVPGLGGVPGLPASPPPKVSIAEVAVFQGVKVSVFAEGERVAERNAPLIAGRPALLRVYVAPLDGFQAGKFAGELTLKGPDGKVTTLRDVRTLTAKSTDAVATSTLNFELPPEALALGTTFSVSVTDDGSTNQEPARYPAGTAVDDLELKASNVLKVVVVPVRFDADSSRRLPDVSEAQLAVYRRTMMALYPATDVTVTARAPYAWSNTIAPNGQGWDTVLNAMVSLRRDDRADSETYYYGVFNPSASFGSFCSRGCVTGLSGLVNRPADAFLRASVGLGFTGVESANTMAHEIGHAHGREHAPCGGASGADRSFPHRGGGIGSWGYDILSKKLISPTTGKDMMGYCDPAWVSDYTFSALYDRILAVSGAQEASAQRSTAGGGGSYRIVSFDGDGEAKTSDVMHLDHEPEGAPQQVEYLGESSRVMARATAHVYRYDHLPGGIVVAPEKAGDVRALRVAGFTRSLTFANLRVR
ncbi:MAG TPA: M66 family metalloprotease [Polyangiaceae bacterium]|nr:M66 family metalloprotease [Polyangiaceae bacterium]